MLPLAVADVIVFGFNNFFTQVKIGLLGFFLLKKLSLGDLLFPIPVRTVTSYGSVHIKHRVFHDFPGNELLQFLRIELQDLNSLDEFRGHGQLLRLFNCKIIT